jgi:arylsulfatase A-like enzyme
MMSLARSVLVLLATIVFVQAEDGKRPANLVIIMADDLGYADVGFNGCRDIPTPHIDSIAAHGVRFTDGYTAYPTCSPSRAGLLTGRYPQRFGHERNPEWSPTKRYSGLPHTETTLAQLLSGAGYHTGLIGIWHLGCHPDLHPVRRGFHEFFGCLGGAHHYFSEEWTIKNTVDAKEEKDSHKTWMLRNDIPEKTTKYLTDQFSMEAGQFIQSHKEKPFFLWVSYNAPHVPLQAPQEYLERFPKITDPKRRTYAAMVSALDDGVGRILETLRKESLEENTMVCFLSDNGGPLEKNGSSNQPLRGAKGQPWEGGIRVPFAMQWPRRIPKGMVYQKPVLSLDIFATIAQEAGVRPDQQRPIDGVDLVPYLTKQKFTAPHPALFWRIFDDGAFAVRSGDFKLVIETKDSPPKLYQVRGDRAEEKDMARNFPEKVAQLQQLRTQWNAEMIPPAFKGRAEGRVTSGTTQEP